MKLVENWREAWKWFSMQAFALIVVLPFVWAGLPADAKAMIPDSWEKWILVVLAVAGGLGRIVDQNKGKA